MPGGTVWLDDPESGTRLTQTSQAVEHDEHHTPTPWLGISRTIGVMAGSIPFTGEILGSCPPERATRPEWGGITSARL